MGPSRVDENLKWKPSDYGGLDDIRVHVDEVFRPDITIINAIDTENVVRSTTHSDLILWNSGEIFWMPAISMKTICDVDLTNWPFDQQTCIYRFASWTYDGDSLDLRNSCKWEGWRRVPVCGYAMFSSLLQQAKLT